MASKGVKRLRESDTDSPSSQSNIESNFYQSDSSVLDEPDENGWVGYFEMSK